MRIKLSQWEVSSFGVHVMSSWHFTYAIASYNDPHTGESVWGLFVESDRADFGQPILVSPVSVPGSLGIVQQIAEQTASETEAWLTLAN